MVTSLRNVAFVVSEVVNVASGAMDCLFFFQAEDGIRYLTVTGVQTCALPISSGAARAEGPRVRPERHRCMRRLGRDGDAPSRARIGGANEARGSDARDACRVDEPVAEAGRGLDLHFAHFGILELLAQTSAMNVDKSRVGAWLVSPDTGQQVVAREHASGLAR